MRGHLRRIQYNRSGHQPTIQTYQVALFFCLFATIVTMSTATKLDNSGVCNLCQTTAQANEYVQCFMCKDSFHAVCPNTPAAEKIATKTTVSSFLLNSTKSNFLFLCDCCLTKFEISLANTEAQRINELEQKFLHVDTQLSEIKTLLSAQSSKLPETGNPWFDKQNWGSVKAPPAPSVLVISKHNDVDKNKENLKVVEKKVMDNNIPLQKTFKNKKGDLCMVLNSAKTRDDLSVLVNQEGSDIVVEKRDRSNLTVSIVGLTEESDKEHVKAMFIKQNDFVSRFAAVNSIDEHFKVLSVRPLKNNSNKFQVFASVSPIIREGLKNNYDRVILGLVSCKVYDQHHVKRCFKCQSFGHYSRDCTADESTCAKCSGSHSTSECTSGSKKCINCTRKGLSEHDHYASDHTCPIFQSEVEKKKQNALNSHLSHISHPS